MKRRDFLKTLGVGTLAAPTVFSMLSSCDSATSPVNPELQLTLTTGRTNTGAGLSSAAILINDSFLGPTIRVRKGDAFTAKLRNELSEPSNIHWHGLTVAAKMDGHPIDAIPGGGGSFEYSFKVIDRPGTYWYHAHPDMQTGRQVYLGHAGFFIIGSAEEDALGLPTGDNDIPLVIQDKRLDAGGEMIYAPTKIDKITGWLGDIIFVNGKPQATHSVGQERYRLRLLNGSNARVYKIGFADGRLFHLIANGGMLDTSIQVDHVYLSSAERADIIVDFGGDAIGTSQMLRSLAFPFDSTHQNYDYPQGKEFDLVRFDIGRAKQKEFSIPGTLLPYEILSESQAVKTRVFTLTMDHDAERGMHRINDILFDMQRVDYQVNLGDLEVWEFENQGDSLHNMHVHGTQFQVLDRSSGSLMPTDRGWKDTVIIWPSERVRVITRFDQYKGIYLLHCHNLEHEDDGMMINMEVV